MSNSFGDTFRMSPKVSILLSVFVFVSPSFTTGAVIDITSDKKDRVQKVTGQGTVEFELKDVEDPRTREEKTDDDENYEWSENHEEDFITAGINGSGRTAALSANLKNESADFQHAGSYDITVTVKVIWPCADGSNITETYEAQVEFTWVDVKITKCKSEIGIGEDQEWEAEGKPEGGVYTWSSSKDPDGEVSVWGFAPSPDISKKGNPITVAGCVEGTANVEVLYQYPDEVIPIAAGSDDLDVKVTKGYLKIDELTPDGDREEEVQTDLLERNWYQIQGTLHDVPGKARNWVMKSMRPNNDIHKYIKNNFSGHTLDYKYLQDVVPDGNVESGKTGKPNYLTYWNITVTSDDFDDSDEVEYTVHRKIEIEQTGSFEHDTWMTDWWIYAGAEGAGGAGGSVSYTFTTSQTYTTSHSITSTLGVTVLQNVLNVQCAFQSGESRSISEQEDRTVTVTLDPNKWLGFFRRAQKLKAPAAVTTWDVKGNKEDGGSIQLFDYKWAISAGEICDSAEECSKNPPPVE